ncbi:emerin [Mixophyes fleayi]|uniref:emerin n=1 Tax=Mixophyes fleayi TaxID=3061075 RepID=UPI003F4DA56A
MNKFRNMTDDEIIKTLSKYGITHGPIVDSTRTLYEKKLFEYERKKTTFPTSTNSSHESRQQYSRRDYDNDNGDNETYEEETYTKTYNYPEAYQRPRDDLQSKSYSSRENTYQNVSQIRHQSSFPQGVEPRRPIRPKKKEEAEQQPIKRFLPLWLQLFLLVLFAGFLVYMYLCQTDENPFRSIDGIL